MVIDDKCTEQAKIAEFIEHDRIILNSPRWTEEQAKFYNDRVAVRLRILYCQHLCDKYNCVDNGGNRYDQE